MHRIILNILLISVFSGSFTSTVHSEEPNSISKPNVLAEFKIDDVERLGCILLPVKFDGEEYKFLLDTGCTDILCDTSFKAKLGRRKGIRTDGTTPGGEIVAESYDAPEAFLGPFDLQECGEVLCYDLNYCSQAIGRKIHGIIGMNFLKKYVVQIDFDRKTLSFIKAKSDMERDWGVEVPIIYGRIERPLVRANVLGSIKTYFFIDTGASESGGLDSAILEYILLEHNIRIVGRMSIAASGARRTRVFRIDRLSLGELEYKDLVFSERQNGSSLGLDFWSRHTVTFDFPNSKVYLKKGKDFHRITELDMSGLYFRRIADKTVVVRAIPDSPAGKAGIKEGDIILDIMGKEADSYETWEIAKLLKSEDKRQIRMTIKRGNEIKKVSFLLEKVI